MLKDAIIFGAEETEEGIPKGTTIYGVNDGKNPTGIIYGVNDNNQAAQDDADLELRRYNWEHGIGRN